MKHEDLTLLAERANVQRLDALRTAAFLSDIPEHEAAISAARAAAVGLDKLRRELERLAGEGEPEGESAVGYIVSMHARKIWQEVQL